MKQDSKIAIDKYKSLSDQIFKTDEKTQSVYDRIQHLEKENA